MAWLPAALIGSAAMNYFGAQSASNAATDANNANIAYQQQYNQQRDPFSTGGNRQQYVTQLNDFMKGGYSGIMSDPMFQQMQKQSMEATQRMMSSRGMGVGTNDILALQNSAYTQGMDFFNQKYNMLSQLSGAAQPGMQPVQGMSPQLAGQMAYAPYQSMGQSIGQIASIYGRGAGSGGGGPTAQTDYMTGYAPVH